MIKSLEVYLRFDKKLKVGILAIKDNKLYFEYDKEFLKSNLEISPYKLPLKAGLMRCDDDTFEGIWGVFADSMPDGWGRLLLDRHFIKKGINPKSLSAIDRLSYVGDDGIGALVYEPKIEINNDIKNLDLDEIFHHSQKVLKGDESLIDELLTLNGSSGGARPKVLVQISDDKKNILYDKKLKKGFSPWIVKFASSNDISNIGKIEYVYSLMAKTAKIEMSETYLFNNKYFATKRFDIVDNKRKHLHSLAGLIHSDFRYPTLDYDDIMSLTLHLTKDIQEVQKIYRLAVFNLLTHNRDDHAKNFSFIMDNKGKWQFAPAYDLTYSFGVGSEHSTMYLGEGKNPTFIHLEKLAKKHNIKKYKQIIDEVRYGVSKFSEFVKSVNVSKKTISDLEKVFKSLDKSIKF